MTAASVLVLEASLSYLGLGAQPPTPSWGSMLRASFQSLFWAPWYGVIPGSCIAVVALAYTWLADGLQAEMLRGGSIARTERTIARLDPRQGSASDKDPARHMNDDDV
jgi:ABC-type dipeptide/oligopeptide/nickel transport system permease subunit